jgi:hypothetical protein
MNIFTKFDFLGNKPIFKTQGEDRIKTLLDGLFSLIILVLSLAMSIFFGLELTYIQSISLSS